ncbi:MAG: UDP-3-O-(3-hydroxymyristoyl)glucosamine N-acyltransferase [Pelagibacterales bacterium]|nr:UDP-3-O-(3-hydroxymyristoyl)glucosamine N-acyltransferase [Pelagibacterales bacterium]
MERLKFFDKKHEFLTIEQICEITSSKVAVAVDKNQRIYDVATLDKGTKSDISFLSSGQYFSAFQNSSVGFCFVDEKYSLKTPQNICALVNKNPYFAYSQIADAFYKEKEVFFPNNGLIHETAEIGENPKIAPNAYIGKNVKIGKNVFIGPNAVVMDNCIIGDNCKIFASAVISYAIIGNNCSFFNGSKIGQDGFGFAHNAGINHKIIQLGIVKIGNDVEIGANTCIDRGAIENTVIKDGVKIDNLCQIGHNVIIDSGTVIAGASAVAGSARIGKFVQVGGKSSIAGHLTVGDGARVAGMSGVAKDVDPMQVVAGIPAAPIRTWHKINAKLLQDIKK